MAEFVEFPKIARLYDTYNPVIITEKIDGSNGALQIEDGKLVAVQSRKKIITPEDDNYGFATWAYANAETLASDLGDGTHFGEWAGNKIQRGYDMPKKFYLFNADRWNLTHFETNGLDVVPLLFKGVIEMAALDEVVRDALAYLEVNGSEVNPDFKRPEGIVVYFTSNRMGFKVIPPTWGKGGQKRDVAENFEIWNV